MDEFIPFYEYFPALATKETTLIYVQKNNNLKPGEYILVENYCNDKKCDCRKVMLNVVSRYRPGIILATIGYGWESIEFYITWAFGELKLAKLIMGVYLEPMCIQSEHSTIFLDFINNMVKEESFKSTMIRHYKLFKNHVNNK